MSGGIQPRKKTKARTTSATTTKEKRRRSRKGDSNQMKYRNEVYGDAQTKAELQAAADAVHAAWQYLKMDTRNAQL